METPNMISVATKTDTCEKNDYHFLKKAFALAERVEPHRTYPNPRVGAVLTRNGNIVADGYHEQAGSAHAEAMAIEKAGAHSKGATLYTTLEPCSRNSADKKTPPCVGKIIEAGISRVVVGAIDPHAGENGRGIRILQEHNICVVRAHMQEHFARQNESYTVRMRHSRPLLEVKLAQTSDGYSADNFNQSQWISDRGALFFAHRLRARYHAIMVGANTARYDNPQLSARFGLDYYPTRIVLDRTLSLPLSLKLFQDATQTDTYLVHDTTMEKSEKSARIDDCGVHRIALDSTKDDFYEQLFAYFEQERICGSILIEGGSKTISALIERGIWDRLSLIIAPTLLMNGRRLQSSQQRHMEEIIALDKSKWQSLKAFQSNCIALRGYRDCTHSFGISTDDYGGSWDV